MIMLADRIDNTAGRDNVGIYEYLVSKMVQ
jgi:hypothetical protein